MCHAQGAGDRAVNKTDQVLVLWELTFRWSRRTMNGTIECGSDECEEGRAKQVRGQRGNGEVSLDMGAQRCPVWVTEWMKDWGRREQEVYRGAGASRHLELHRAEGRPPSLPREPAGQNSSPLVLSRIAFFFASLTPIFTTVLRVPFLQWFPHRSWLLSRLSHSCWPSPTWGLGARFHFWRNSSKSGALEIFQ